MSTATVIVPSRGPAGRLERLLESLSATGSGHETLIVDNGSPGAEVTRCCKRYGFADAIRLERNAGFSAAVNLAAGRASGDALVLLNDDCVCDPGFVEQIAAGLDRSRSVVMAAGVMRDLARPDLIDTAGMELDRTLLVYDYLNGEPLAALAGAGDPVGPSAAAAAFDREAFLEVGGFDEGLFAYWEDVDLVIRLHLSGGRCVLARDAFGTHEHSATLGSGSAEKNYLMGYGRGYVLRKWSVLSPRRLGSVLGREAALMLGQAAIDRNFAGWSGRVRGWRASSRSEPFPASVAAVGGGRGLLGTLSRRLRRRGRLTSRR